MLKAKLTKVGKQQFLEVTIPINENPTPSATGKTLTVASTRGNKETEVQVNGKSIIIGLNAYVYP